MEFEKLLELIPARWLGKIEDFIDGLQGDNKVVEIVLGVGRNIEVRWRAVLKGGLKKADVLDTKLTIDDVEEVYDRPGNTLLQVISRV